MLTLQHQVVAALTAEPRAADQIAAAAGQPDQAETAFKILEHLAANPGRGVARTGGRAPRDARFQKGLHRREPRPPDPTHPPPAPQGEGSEGR